MNHSALSTQHSALRAIAAIAKTDVLIRFRRLSTIVVFLILGAVAYLWVPDPKSGYALMQIGRGRAFYNSAAIGVATAILGTFFVCMAGFYVVSNAIRRDAQTRCGAILAATTMRSGEYLAGKFLGNVLFLGVFFSGFMLVSMVMVIVRGEASLEPLIFLRQYLLIAPAPIIYVSALAILFESVPWLSGRFGDVAYFFLFLGSMTFGTVAALEGGMHWAVFFDPTAMSSTLLQMKLMLNTNNLSIGASSFDVHQPPVIYHGLVASWEFLAQRLAAMLVPLPLLLLARASFHRFDPVRVKVAAKGQGKWLSRMNTALKPLTGWLGGRGLVSADAAMTITSAPLIAIALIGIAIAALAAPPAGVMPIAFAALAIAIADVACRDQLAGTTALIRSAPRVRERFVWWKTASAGVIAAAFLAVPALRAGVRGLLPLLAGAFFVVAAATALGVISGNAKTFIVVFLSFWYVVINDRGATRALDFAGFYGKATPVVAAAYVAIGLGLLIVAQLVYALRLRRE
jgi:hypothetical protein